MDHVCLRLVQSFEAFSVSVHFHVSFSPQREHPFGRINSFCHSPGPTLGCFVFYVAPTFHYPHCTDISLPAQSLPESTGRCHHPLRTLILNEPSRTSCGLGLCRPFSLHSLTRPFSLTACQFGGGVVLQSPSAGCTLQIKCP